jgi:D-alanyl-D-alanine carboxypeptidase
MHPLVPPRCALTALPISLLILGCVSAAPQERSHASIVATAQTSPLKAEPAAEIEEYLDSIYDRTQPGAAVLVARDGETIVREAYGMADLELGVPLRPEHVFGIGSITKQFTAVAVLMLAEEGKLSLDDDITRFIPEYPTHGHRITIEDLLHHTSGIRSYTAMPEFQEMMRVDLTLDSLIAVFQHEPLDFAPRENWIYSNSGYVLLGKIIEEASGQAYADFLRQHVFEPSGLESTYYGGARRIIPGRVSGYERLRDGWRNAEYVSMTIPHAAGALLSTVEHNSTSGRTMAPC